MLLELVNLAKLLEGRLSNAKIIRRRKGLTEMIFQDLVFITSGTENLMIDGGFYLLLAGVLVSFLDPGPDGEGRVPLDFFGRTVPLLTVDRRGSVAIIGLAGRKKRTTEARSSKIRNK